MRTHPIRVVYTLVACCCATMVLIGIRQSLLLDSASSPPFGHSFHREVAHVHAWEVGEVKSPPTVPVPTIPREPDANRFFPRVNETMDRIVNQLSHKPPVTGTATIVVYTGLPGELKDGGKEKLHADGCLVTDCHYTDDVSAVSTADAVLWQQGMMGHGIKRPAGQIWAAFFLESPMNSQSLSAYDGQINWLASYRRDSVLVTPYEKFVPFPNASLYSTLPARNYAANKTIMAAWFVSNCGAANGRLNYVSELQKHVQVDIYGGCGPLRCERFKADECFRKLNRDYKFYLAFENSNCRDYITEKFYWNGLYNDVVPVVMGARREDYAAVAPPHSYIHVDDFASPRDLAAYLHKLDKDDALYNAYFAWKGSGEFINTKFWCRLCTAVHAARLLPQPLSVISKPDEWWRGKDTCIIPRDKSWATWRDIEIHNDVKPDDVKPDDVKPDDVNQLHAVK